MKRIQSKGREIGTYKTKKILLQCFNGKRFVSDDGVHRLAHFDKDLKKQINTDDHNHKE